MKIFSLFFFLSVQNQLNPSIGSFFCNYTTKIGSFFCNCIEWLFDSGIINICHQLNFPELPLKGNIDETKYKIYFADTGLLVAILDEEAQDDLRANKNLGVYKGASY